MQSSWLTTYLYKTKDLNVGYQDKQTKTKIIIYILVCLYFTFSLKTKVKSVLLEKLIYDAAFECLKSKYNNT